MTPLEIHRHHNISLRKLTTRGNHDLSLGCTTLRADGFHRPDHIHSLGHGTEDDVLAIEPGSFGGAEEELK